MKTKAMIAGMAAAIFAAVLVLTPQADAKYGKKCSMKGMHSSMDKWGLEEKLLYKLHFIFMNEAELGLSAEQVKSLRQLKMDTKKLIIQKNAEVEVLVVDIHGMLYEPKIDEAAVGKLIDQKYEIKKDKAKALVSAYAKLKTTLSEDQMKKLKELWMKHMSMCPVTGKMMMMKKKR